LLDKLRLSKKKWEAELSENNTLVKRLQDELQNMIGILEKGELETSELHAGVTDLRKELTRKMEKGNEGLVSLRRGYEIKLQSKDREINGLKNKHNECCSKITSFGKKLVRITRT
jgi:chromosome segregation ATPase